ncbi:PREDICTED: mas-related G-protein coupled receptor member X1-like [Elephantulus edwardii]|uniref:mas-related G-protein coupled receptor member X1-like n=1 Tax=Elephantulus edwardii TaxID=28737 RepID=UPI0003F06439|nr:PREDICTED: mas-related G-protein coupled receptor member X1-like [Elephantulus edwardii]
MNGSHPTSSSNNSPEKEPLSLTILTFLIALGGLLGNTVVLWLLGFRLRRNSFSVYILNLAGADFLFLFLEVIISLMIFIDLHSNILFLFKVVWAFVFIADLSILSCISTERCLSVLFPIWYRCRRPRHTSAVTCVVLWTLSLLLGALEGHLCNKIAEKPDNYCSAFHLFLAIWLIFLFVTLLGSNVILLVKIFCDFQKKKLTRIYVTIVLTVLTFLLCDFPFLFRLIPTSLEQLSTSWFIILYCVNSSINPIIYFFVGSYRQQKRPSLGMILQKALQDTPEMDEPGGSVPQETTERSGSSVV